MIRVPRSYSRLLKLGRRHVVILPVCFLSTLSISRAKCASTSNTNTQSMSRIGRWIRQLCSTADINCSNKEDVVGYLKSNRVKKVVVMTGAGISTASGIPDFRTPGTGLYDNVQKYNLPYPEAVFDIEYFMHNQKPFFALAQELYPSGYYRPNAVHYFIKLLDDKGLLLRNYTQNIDGLERLAGVPGSKLVEAHGSFATATCRVCHKSYTGEDIKGVIKPDIVFFGENLPMKFFSFSTDLPQADLLIVMGTSLEVYPFAGIAEATLPGVPRILFNKEACGPFVSNPRTNDVVVEGDLVEEVLQFCELLGWKQDLNNLMQSSEARFNEQ